MNFRQWLLEGGDTAQTHCRREIIPRRQSVCRAYVGSLMYQRRRPERQIHS
jgi:hypothetical protein